MAAQTYYVLHKGGRQTIVAGVLSETTPDEEVYDLTNYRDMIDALYAGAAISGFNVPDDPVNAPTGALADSIIHTSDAAESYTSLSDNVAHVAPRNEKKKRTRLMLWNGAGGTGDVLFAGWMDRIDSYSIGTYSRV